MLCAHVTLPRQRLLLCHLRDTLRQSTRSIFLGETTVFSSSLWVTMTPCFPSQPFKRKDTMSSTLHSALAWRRPPVLASSIPPCWSSFRSAGQTGSLLSSTRCFPERETSLPFLSGVLLAPDRTSSTYRKRVQIPQPLCNPTANI